VKKNILAAEPPVLLTVPQAAYVLSVSRTKVYELIFSGHLESITIGSLRRIPRASIDRFVRSELAGGGH
jgi:excisionase family DNA binding protein